MKESISSSILALGRSIAPCDCAGIRVSIDGHGSDELLGGYHFYVERAIDAAAGSLDLRRYLDLRRVLAGLRGRHFWPTMRAYWASFVGFHGASRPAGSPRAAARPWFAASRPTDSAMGKLLLPYDGPHRLYDEAADPRVAGMSPLQAMLFTWFHGLMLPTLLRVFDRASMAHGIEVRMPFMDWRLVTYSFALPETSKIGGGYTKRVLREAMQGILPEPIRLRTKKIGFIGPMKTWASGALKPWLLDLSASRSFIESSVWNGPAARAAVERAVDGKASIDPVWPILNAYVLEQAFKVRARDAKLREIAGCLRSRS